MSRRAPVSSSFRTWTRRCAASALAGLAILATSLLLASPAEAGRCPRRCAKLFATELRTCKAECPRRKPGKACRAACLAQRRAAAKTCRESAAPTPPTCGSAPAGTPTTTTLPATATSTTLAACVPTTCTLAGVECGTTPDGCGGSLSCGACPPQAPVCADGTCHDACFAEANGTACNDGDACTTADVCQGGACIGTAPVVCDLPGMCRTPGSCDPATGQCTYPDAPNGTACDDGNACSLGDTCQDGECSPGAPVICIPDLFPAACRQAVRDCHPLTGECIARSVPDGTACDDGNACSVADTCEAGACTGPACPPGRVCCSTASPCVDLATDSANCGACGNACVDGVCLDGQCYDGCVIGSVGYAQGTRNPANPCEACDVALSRTAWTALGPGFPNPPITTCTVGCFNGFCSRGTCVGLGATPTGGVCGAPSICLVSACNAFGVCVSTPVNQGQPCTPPLSVSGCRSGTIGVCDAGTCVAAPANEGGYCRPAEPPPSPCRSSHDGTCRNGTCVHDVAPDGTTCDADLSGLEPIHHQCNAGTCRSGSCTLAPRVGATCHRDPSDRCQVSTCLDVPHLDFSLCSDPLPKTCPDACGDGSTCDPVTGMCQGHRPSFGTVTCSSPSGPEPDRCCPGQVCICQPTPNGIPNFCLIYGCWDPQDVPGGSGSVGGTPR